MCFTEVTLQSIFFSWTLNFRHWFLEEVLNYHCSPTITVQIVSMLSLLCIFWAGPNTMLSSNACLRVGYVQFSGSYSTCLAHIASFATRDCYWWFLFCKACPQRRGLRGEISSYVTFHFGQKIYESWKLPFLRFLVGGWLNGFFILFKSQREDMSSRYVLLLSRE